MVSVCVSLKTADPCMTGSGLPAVCLQGIRTLVAVNDEALAQQQEGTGVMFGETWVAYPDDVPLRAKHPGDTRAAFVPWLAHQVRDLQHTATCQLSHQAPTGHTCSPCATAGPHRWGCITQQHASHTTRDTHAASGCMAAWGEACTSSLYATSTCMIHVLPFWQACTFGEPCIRGQRLS